MTKIYLNQIYIIKHCSWRNVSIDAKKQDINQVTHPDYSDLYALDGDVDSWTIGGSTETEANIINANNNMQELQA